MKPISLSIAGLLTSDLALQRNPPSRWLETTPHTKANKICMAADLGWKCMNTSLAFLAFFCAGIAFVIIMAFGCDFVWAWLVGLNFFLLWVMFVNLRGALIYY